MGLFKVLLGVGLGVGAVAAAPFTGGGSIFGAASLAGSLAGAGMAFLVVAGQAQIYIGITLQDIFRQPALHGGTTPTAIDDADRHIEYLG